MKTNTPLAIWSLILGIVSIVMCGPATAIPAVICGHMARAKIKGDPEKWTGDGMALAGLIMGYFSIVASILLFILAIIAAILVPSVIKMFPAVANSSVACVILPFF